MIYPHHAAKVCSAVEKVGWRRGFTRLKQGGTSNDQFHYLEDSAERESGNDSEDFGFMAAGRLLEEKEKRLGFFSAIKASREQQQKTSSGLMKVNSSH
jgi:hypothetical protein